MQLLIRCESCGAVLTIFHGDLLDLPPGLALHERIAQVCDTHDHPLESLRQGEQP